jgi:hypothetical protein
MRWNGKVGGVMYSIWWAIGRVGGREILMERKEGRVWEEEEMGEISENGMIMEMVCEREGGMGY